MTYGPVCLNLSDARPPTPTPLFVVSENTVALYQVYIHSKPVNHSTVSKPVCVHLLLVSDDELRNLELRKMFVADLVIREFDFSSRNSVPLT